MLPLLLLLSKLHQAAIVFCSRRNVQQLLTTEITQPAVDDRNAPIAVTRPTD